MFLVFGYIMAANTPVLAAGKGKDKLKADTLVRPLHLGLCAACHGDTGLAHLPDVPNLAGQRLDYMRKALKAYRDGSRNVAVMKAAIGPLSDADLDTLVRWYSRQPQCGTTKAVPAKHVSGTSRP